MGDEKFDTRRAGKRAAAALTGALSLTSCVGFEYDRYSGTESAARSSSFDPSRQATRKQILAGAIVEHDAYHEYYRVGQGDNSWGLAGELKLDRQLQIKLEVLNPNVDFSDLKIGTTIRAPRGALRPSRTSSSTDVGISPPNERSRPEAAQEQPPLAPHQIVSTQQEMGEAAGERQPNTVSDTNEQDNEAGTSPLITETLSTYGPLALGTKAVRIRNGDSLYRIAQETLGSGERYPEIQALNPEINPRELKPGMYVELPSSAKTTDEPGSEYYRITIGDSLWSISEKTLGRGALYHQLIALNPALRPEDLKEGFLIKIAGTIPEASADTQTATPNVKAKTAYSPPSPPSPRLNQSTFDKALTFVTGKNIEGEYVNDPDDRGGATNCGITHTTYDSWRKRQGLPSRDVRDIEWNEVIEIYRHNYWTKAKCQRLPEKLAIIHFDTAVNMGHGGASTVLRRAVKACGIKLARGDILSPQNCALISAADQAKLVESYLEKRIQRYHAIVAAHPSQEKYLRGWLNRVRHLRAAVGS